MKTTIVAASEKNRRSEKVLQQRVLDAISEQQNAGERLVGWFQLAVVILFGLLYFVSPKGFSSDTVFEPVPWFLSVYFVLTIIRLLLSYRRRLPSPLLYASVIVDMGLLLGMIWIFHLQYQQSPAFYLKSPTLLYVFIFIALRALRFEARYVVTAGLFAAVGWVLLAVYAIFSSDNNLAITRDYVHYMKSNSILVGAEFDKVITILTVTAILTVAITRARRLLIKAVTERAAVHDLSRFFSPEIAEQITTAEQQITVGQGHKRNAAILMTDIRGFTSLAATTPPDILMQMLAEYQSRLVPIIQQHGGAIDKFMGDGIMATFGAVASNPEYAADALRALEDILIEAESWQSKGGNNKRIKACRVGAAVAEGPVIVGAVGDDTRMEYTVIGDAVNIAAKLEKHTKKENARALCTADMLNKAVEQGFRPTIQTQQLNSRMVEGLTQPLDIVALRV